MADASYWLLQGIPPLWNELSNIPQSLNLQKNGELETQEKIVALVRNRLRRQRKLLVSDIRDLREDQPAAFLQVGNTRNLAVCRIVRYFPRKDFLSFMEDILEILTKNPKIAENFDSIAKLKEIFLIPDKVADEIFSVEVINKLPESLPNSSSTEERSRRSSEYSLILLNALKELTESQLAKLNPIPVGTGFLVGATHLLTNYHVLFDKQVARQCVAQFNYEELLGTTQKEVDYEFDPDTLFIQEPSLDYALVQLKSNQLNRQAGYNFGWLQLVEDDANIIPDLSEEQYILAQLETEGYELSAEEKKGDNVILIHHPKGVQKKIDLTNNRVAPGGLYKKVLRYQGESDYGSSGCPVFNTKWELVALNHAAIPRSDGSFVKQGIRICRIVEDLKHKSTNDFKLQSFVEDFVVTAEQLNYPSLHAGLKFNGISDYVNIDGKVAFASCATNFNEDSDPKSVKAGIGTIKVWNSSGVELRTLTHLGVQKIEFSPNGQWLASSGGFYTAEVIVWDVETGKTIKVLSIKDEQILNDPMEQEDLRSVESLSFSPSRPLLAVANWFGQFTLWDVDNGDWLNQPNGSLLAAYPQLKDLKGSIVQFSQDGQFLAAANILTTLANQESVQLWKTDDWTLLQKLEVIDPRIIRFDPNSEILAIATSSNGGGFLQFFNLKTRVLGEKFKAGELDISEIKFISEGSSIKDEILLSVDSGGLVRSWSLDGLLLKEIQIASTVSQAGIENASFSPDGKSLTTFGISDAIAQMSIVTLETQEITSIKHFQQQTTKFRTNATSNIARAEVKFNPYAISPKGIGSSVKGMTQLITVEAWINPDGNGGGAVLDLALEFAPKQIGRFVLGVTPQTEVAGFLNMSFSGADGVTLNSGMGEVSLAEFTHVAAVINIQVGREKIACYINGRKSSEVPLSSQSLASTLVFPRLKLIGASLEETITAPSFEYFYNGENANTTPSLSDFFKGIITEVRLWNVDQSEQITENMYRPLTGKEDGLTGYWRFEEGEGDRVIDVLSKPEDYGVAVGTKRLTTNQLPFFQLPLGLIFSEGDDRLDCCNHSDLSVIGQITVEAWVKHQYGNCLIVNRGVPSNRSYSLIWHEGKIRVVLQSEDLVIVDARSFAPQDQVWHHVAFTWDSNTSEVSIYIDGRSQDSVVIEGRSKTIVADGKSQTFGVFADSLESVTDPLQIGVKAQGGKYRSVVIADVRLWNVCRPQAQIKANMSRRLNSDVEKDNGLIGYWRLDEGSDDQVINLVSKAPATIHGAKWFPMPTVSEQTTTVQPS